MPAPTCVLLHGEESFLIREQSVQLLKDWRSALVSDFGFEALDGAALTAERLRDAVLQAPFLDPYRVVAARFIPVRRCEGLSAALAAVPETTRILLTVSGRLPSAHKLLKAVAALPNARVSELAAPRGRAFSDWVYGRAREHGLTTQAAALVLRSAPSDLGVIDSELAKLAAYQAATGSLDPAAIRELLAGGRQDEIYRLTDLLLPRPSPEAWRVLEGLLQRESATLIAYRVARHLALLLEIRTRQERGDSLAEIQSTLGEHRFVVQKAYETARSAEGPRLEDGLAALLRYEWEVKSGQIDADQGLLATLASL